MNKEETIRRYGEEAYEKVCYQMREWNRNNPEKVKTRNQEQNRKGGKYYEQKRAYDMRGLRHVRNIIRSGHNYKWAAYKQIIAPDSQLHHQWIHRTANYQGVALVEKDPHMHGFIDVIQILEGEITLLTEEAIQRGA